MNKNLSQYIGANANFVYKIILILWLQQWQMDGR